jgi:hypothetical protein
MQQQTLPVGAKPNVIVASVSGDLRVAGWERAEMMVRTDGEELEVTPNADPIGISCDGDLILYLPGDVNLKVDKVDGDASLQALRGPVALGPVSGDLTMNDLGAVTLETVGGDASLRNIGALDAEHVSGDFALRGGHGVCAIETVGGDTSLRDVTGMITIRSVSSDLYVRNAGGAVNVSSGGDAALYVVPKPGLTYDVTAGGELIARLPPEANVRLHLRGSSSESIHVDFPGVKLPEDSAECEVVLGMESGGMAEMILTASGDLLVTSHADPWESAADFGVGMGDRYDWPLPPDFSERINRQVQAALENTRIHLEEASRHAETTGRRASVKVEAAMRRAEAKARAAEVRARRGQFNVHVGRWNWDLTPHEPEESSAPTSDEERLMILKMLQEKKITVEEAEKLLAALEGK